MAIPQHLSVRKIKALALRQTRRTNVNDAAMIAMCGYCYCSKLELSLLNVEDVLTESGMIKPEVIMPKRITGRQDNRYFVIGKKGLVFDLLNKTIEWRMENDFEQLRNVGLFGGLKPDSRLFRKPDGEVFKTRVNNRDNLEPYTLNNYLKRINFGESIDTKALQESFIVNTWNNSMGRGVPEVDALKSLHAMTGLQVSTIKPKVIRSDERVRTVLKNMYSSIGASNCA